MAKSETVCVGLQLPNGLILQDSVLTDYTEPSPMGGFPSKRRSEERRVGKEC